MDEQTLLLHKDVLDVLNKRIQDFKEGYRQNIAILGDELTGKTTLIKNLIGSVQDEKLIPVYVEIIPYEFPIFLKRFLSSLLYNFLKKTQLISSRESLEMMIRRTRELLPQTAALCESMMARIDKERFENLFKEIIALIETFRQESRLRCLIVFDEFHNLKKLEAKNICADLGKWLMFEKNTLFIFLSSRRPEAKQIIANDLSLLFGNFETIELGMLNSDSSAALIREKFNGITVAPEYAHFLIHFTGGHPFYLKIICDEAAALCRLRQMTSLGEEILIEALERLLFNEWGILNLKFMTALAMIFLNRYKNDFIYLLDAIAIGKNRLKDLTGFLKKPRKEINLKIHRLIELGILSRSGSFYSVNDRLLCLWLKFVHYEKMNSLSPDYTEQVLHFRDKMRSEIKEFIATSQQAVPQRLMELFNQFEDDDILMDRKKVHLSIFKELRLISFDTTDLKIGIFGKAQDSVWLAAIKEDDINERDINDFMLIAKKFKHRVLNKVIIGLGPIERNARLLAKESRIATWDIASVNNLCDVFGKPRIVK